MKNITFNNKQLQIIYKYNLQYEWMYIINSSKSNHLPYHNLRHTLNVVECCHDIYSSYFNNVDVPYENLRDLLVAALFHDFNHSGGSLSDDKNVEIAINNMRQYYQYQKFTSKERLDSISTLIYATKYPYENNDLLSIREMVIRDADLAQSASSDFIYFVLGLFEENKNITSVSCAIKGAIKFNKSNKFFLKESYDLYEKKRQNNIIDLENILKMYE